MQHAGRYVRDAQQVSEVRSERSEVGKNLTSRKLVFLMNLSYSCKTDIGRVRSHNEDAVQIFKNEQMLIMVIADGMGGHAFGDVASKMATRYVEGQFNDELVFKDKEEVGSWFGDVLTAVNASILDYAREYKAGKMGTTLVIAVVTEAFIAFANIGDSRAYILAYDRLRQVTKDHTFVRELVEKGQISERAARLHPKKNVINKALGASEYLEFDFLTLEKYKVDAILLCTDGLTGLVEDQEILAVLKTEIATNAKVNQLIEKANARGGRDNVSIALVEFKEGVL